MDQLVAHAPISSCKQYIPMSPQGFILESRYRAPLISDNKSNSRSAQPRIDHNSQQKVESPLTKCSYCNHSTHAEENYWVKYPKKAPLRRQQKHDRYNASKSTNTEESKGKELILLDKPAQANSVRSIPSPNI
jgi:hypothetical protein